MGNGVVGIIDYGMGNIRSVQNAFMFLNQEYTIITSPPDIRNVEKLVLPGVGAFGRAMANLATMGFIDALNNAVMLEKKPFLGICLGMQLICRSSSESGTSAGLNWINASVVRFPRRPDLRVPHVGWNNLEVTSSDGLLREVTQDVDVYFVHSYFVDSQEPEYIAAFCSYGQRFAAAIQYENVYATQFHPEKSQKAGLTILRNFSAL